MHCNIARIQDTASAWQATTRTGEALARLYCSLIVCEAGHQVIPGAAQHAQQLHGVLLQLTHHYLTAFAFAPPSPPNPPSLAIVLGSCRKASKVIRK